MQIHVPHPSPSDKSNDKTTTKTIYNVMMGNISIVLIQSGKEMELRRWITFLEVEDPF